MPRRPISRTCKECGTTWAKPWPPAPTWQGRCHSCSQKANAAAPGERERRAARLQAYHARRDPTVAPMRVCSRCGTPNPATGEYFVHDKKCRGGITHRCKVCANAIGAAWRARHARPFVE